MSCRVMGSHQNRVNGSDCLVLSPPPNGIKPMRDTQPQRGPGPSDTFYGCDTGPKFSSFGCGCLTLTNPSHPEHLQVGRSCHRQCIPWAFPGKRGGQATVSHCQNGETEPGRMKRHVNMETRKFVFSKTIQLQSGKGCTKT